MCLQTNKVIADIFEESLGACLDVLINYSYTIDYPEASEFEGKKLVAIS